MKKRNKILVVLDRSGYKKNELEYKDILVKEYEEVEFLYTKYEDSLIRKIRNINIIGNATSHLLRWIKSLGYSLKIIIGKKYDRILCFNPIVGAMLGLFRVKNVILCGFLFEEKQNKVYLNFRKWIANIVLINVEKVIVYGSKEVEYYSEMFNQETKFSFIPYGIDFMNQKKYLGKLPLKYGFSGGGSNRDYQTLTAALNQNPPLPDDFIIATQTWKLQGCKSDNYGVLSDVTNETFGDVMQKSNYLVLSLKDSTISAGHMVMLQAMSLGVPIIVNDIPAIRDYIDENGVTFYDSGNVEQLKEILNNFDHMSNVIIEKTKNAKEAYFSRYTSKGLIKRISEID